MYYFRVDIASDDSSIQHMNKYIHICNRNTQQKSIINKQISFITSHLQNKDITCIISVFLWKLALDRLCEIYHWWLVHVEYQM